MNLTPLSIFCLMLVAIAIWLVSVIAARRNLASLFRHQLWRLRDGLADEIIDGKLPNDPAVVDVLNRIERLIAAASEVTVLRVLIAMLITRGHPGPSAPPSDAALTSDQRERLACYRKAMHAKMIKHLFIGSPAGWAAIILLGVAVVVVGTFKDIHRTVKSPLRYAKRVLISFWFAHSSLLRAVEECLSGGGKPTHLSGCM